MKFERMRVYIHVAIIMLMICVQSTPADTLSVAIRCNLRYYIMTHMTLLLR